LLDILEDGLYLFLETPQRSGQKLHVSNQGNEQYGQQAEGGQADSEEHSDNEHFRRISGSLTCGNEGEP
jgi:hypothetical protein